MINELYNSVKKTISIRISSRKLSSMNDSTLKILDLNIPISSVIYMGFVESFTNVFVVVTANELKMYSVVRPTLLFDTSLKEGSQLDTKLKYDRYFSGTYCIYMGTRLGIGSLVIFQRDSTEILQNSKFKTHHSLNLYDPFSRINLNDIFIGSDLVLSVFDISVEDVTRSTPANELSKFRNNSDLELTDQNQLFLSLDLTEPLEFIGLINSPSKMGVMDLATYATSTNTYRMHLIFTFEDYLQFVYTDINYIQGDWYNSTGGSVPRIRNTNFIFTLVYSNNTSHGNSFLYALSVVDEAKPEFHIFIISDIISWIGKFPLTNITDDGCKVEADKSSVTYVPEENVVIIKAYQLNPGDKKKKESFYFYRVGYRIVEYFDVVRSEETQNTLYKFVYISDYLYYLIYKDAHYVDVYTLNTNLNKHYIEYRLDIKSETTFLSGHS